MDRLRTTIFVLALLLSACGPGTTQAPTVDTTPVHTVRPTDPPTAQATASPTSAPTPTSTKAPAASPTSAPTPTPLLDLPEGLIAFVGADGQLWLMEPDGSDRQRITTSAVYRPTWSPDGQLLGFKQRRWPAFYELDSGRTYTKTFGFPEGSFEMLGRVSWSPNGDYLVLDIGSSPERWLVIVEWATGEPIRELVAWGYAWSPDSKRLAFGQRHPLEKPISLGSGQSYDLAVWEVGQPEPYVVFEGSSEVLFSPVAWLADGRLLYGRSEWDEETRQASPGSRWTIVLDDGIGDPEPAQDIPPAFTLDCGGLWARLPAEFRDPQTTGGFSWSPDGQWVVFYAGGWPNWGIYLFNWEEGGEPRRLADGTYPAWQPLRDE
jgi:hypothetical protein